MIDNYLSALESWWYGNLCEGTTAIFSDWLDGLSNSSLLYYLSIGEELYKETLGKYDYE